MVSPDIGSVPVPDEVDYRCWGDLDPVHYSYREPGRVNVHASTTCYVAQSIAVQVILDREYCFFYFFCSWVPVAAGVYPNLNGRKVEAVANRNSCDWAESWFAAESFHEAFRPWGYSFRKLDSRAEPGYYPCVRIPPNI